MGGSLSLGAGSDVIESWGAVRARLSTYDRTHEGKSAMTADEERGGRRFVVYTRTDGVSVLLDAQRPWNAASVHAGPLPECVELAERLSALIGAPPVDSAEEERRAHREGRADPLQTRAEGILGLDEGP
jgi:hypothetical protein